MWRSLRTGLAAGVIIGLGTSLSAVPAWAVSQYTEVGAPFAALSWTPFGGPALDSYATGQLWSSAAVGDVTGDGTDEIVVGGGLSSSLQVYALSGARTAMVDLGGVDVAAHSGGVQASPALGDLNLDGVDDVVAASTANVLAGYSFVGGTGTIFRRQEERIVPSGPTGYLATPAVAQLDLSANPEMVTGSWGQSLSVQTLVGHSPGWPAWLKDTIWSSAAVGDIDGDSANEIVVGGDCAGNDIGTQPCGSVGGGYIWAYRMDGSLKWSWFLRGQVVWSSPALADLNGDGALDVVVGSGGYFAEPAGRVMTALDGRTGTVLWQAATPARVVGSPSLADVTGDGVRDVFVVGYGGYLMAFNGATGAQLWQACVTDGGDCGDVNIGTKSGVAVADVDGDGALEAITQGEQKLRIYDAASGSLETTLRSSYSGTIFAPANSPTVVEESGRAWIVQPVLGCHTAGCTSPTDLVITVFQSASALGDAPWPTFKGSMQRTGAVDDSLPGVSDFDGFVEQLTQDFLDRPASQSEKDFWAARLRAGAISRYDYARAYSVQPEWISKVVNDFYLDTLGRSADAEGAAGWAQAIGTNGMPVAQVASGFYGSPEYYGRIGGTDDAWVRDLYQTLLGRGADVDGLEGWKAALRAGMPRDQVAYGFYQSDESLQVRIDALYQHFLGRPAEGGGVRSWTPFVRAQGDIILAAALAASSEYFTASRS